MKQLASMATASSYFLQERTPNSQNHIRCHSPQFPAHNSFADIRIRRNSKNLSCNCFFTTNSSSNDGPASDRQINKNRFRKMEIEQNPIEFVSKTIVNALKALQKPAAASVLVVLLLMYNFNSALAASGGRMGGSSFSSRSSKSSSRSHSTPRIGAGSGFSYSVCAPSPVGGVYVDPAVGVGSNFSLIMIAFVAFIMVSVFLSECSESSLLTTTEKTSVLKLQVGLLGLARSFQKDLNRIAETADTSTSEGLHYVLTETVLALLRHPDYCISAYSSVDIKRSMEGGEERFNQLSIEERGKFDEETLVNINNIKKQSSTIPRAGGFTNEYILVTILVAAGREHKLPLIYNSKDLKEALQKLASIPSSRTLAVEVLWTPQNEDDTLLERELLQDYPLLKPLQGLPYGEACLELLSQPLLYTERDIDVVDTEAKLSLRKM